MSKLTNPDKLALRLMVGLLILSGIIIPLNSANARNFSNNFLSVDKKNYRNYIALSWYEIWEQIKRKKVAGGSRSNTVCLISPSQLIEVNDQIISTEKIWHQNPLFVWQNTKLKAVSLKDGNHVYWHQEVPEKQTNLFYQGKPLKLGKTYTLVVFNPYETEVKRIQLVAPDRHQKIAADLAEIENQLKSEGADREKIALKKADYFAKQEMWSDVFWELYSIPNPSNQLKETLERLNTHNFCR